MKDDPTRRGEGQGLRSIDNRRCEEDPAKGKDSSPFVYQHIRKKAAPFHGAAFEILLC
jgi:hypothetical protein